MVKHESTFPSLILAYSYHQNDCQQKDLEDNEELSQKMNASPSSILLIYVYLITYLSKHLKQICPRMFRLSYNTGLGYF